MLVLAVPMSVLLAALMAFGDLAESQYYTVIKSTGISFGEVVWPALVAALLVCGGLLYFNTFMLPEANFRASQLWSDIRNKRPGFELQPGTFYDGVEDYNILVEDRPAGTNELIGVTIYDYTEGRDQQAVIRARRGRIRSQAGGRRLTLVLNDGEMHRPRPPTSGSLTSRYETLRFDRHVMHFDLSDVVFSRSNAENESRTTRTTPLPALLDRVDSLRVNLQGSYADLYENVHGDLLPDTAQPPPPTPPARTRPGPPPPRPSGRTDRTLPPATWPTPRCDNSPGRACAGPGPSSPASKTSSGT
jgi:Predicted permeases